MTKYCVLPPETLNPSRKNRLLRLLDVMNNDTSDGQWLWSPGLMVPIVIATIGFILSAVCAGVNAGQYGVTDISALASYGFLALCTTLVVLGWTVFFWLRRQVSFAPTRRSFSRELYKLVLDGPEVLRDVGIALYAGAIAHHKQEATQERIRVFKALIEESKTLLTGGDSDLEQAKMRLQSIRELNSEYNKSLK